MFGTTPGPEKNVNTILPPLVKAPDTALTHITGFDETGGGLPCRRPTLPGGRLRQVLLESHDE